MIYTHLTQFKGWGVTAEGHLGQRKEDEEGEWLKHRAGHQERCLAPLTNLLLLFSKVGASLETMTTFRPGLVTARQALGAGAGWVKPEQSDCPSGCLWLRGVQGQGTASTSGVKWTPAVILCRAVPLLADKHSTDNLCQWRMELLMHIPMQVNWKGWALFE